MAHQVNLFNPILLAPRRYFSAAALVRALALLVVGLVALTGWAHFSAARLQRDLAASAALHATERTTLEAALAAAGAPGPADTAALEQELARAQAALDTRRAQRDALLRDLAGGPNPPSAQLRALATSVPDSIWLDEVRHTSGRLEIRGHTHDTERLRPWIARLAGPSGVFPMPLALHSVERSDAGDGTGPSWRFRVATPESAAEARP
jgi:Tfp pilus assembly protein PilN